MTDQCANCTFPRAAYAHNSTAEECNASFKGQGMTARCANPDEHHKFVPTLTFTPFPKIARLNRDIIVTEKIDGTNAAVGITEDGQVYAQSRTRLITPQDDNFGFAKWVALYAESLSTILGPGVHFGEWWGQGIQRGYGLKEKRFSLFNTARWDGMDTLGGSLRCVPLLYEGPFDRFSIEASLMMLRGAGSRAAPGFDKPEGIVIYHTAARSMFKVTLEKDEAPKGA